MGRGYGSDRSPIKGDYRTSDPARHLFLRERLLAFHLDVIRDSHLFSQSRYSQTSGQLFLEEYHALAMVGKGGLGTLTMDGNTRLCTATAAASMVSSWTAVLLGRMQY
jgi:hypothetical protein